MALNKQDDEVRVKNVFSTHDINVIKITEDKLENILIKHVNKLKKPRDLVGAISLFISLLGIIFTAEFKDILLSGDRWFGIFIAFLGLSIFHLCKVLWNNWKNRSSVESIMNDIKNNKKASKRNKSRQNSWFFKSLCRVPLDDEEL